MLRAFCFIKVQAVLVLFCISATVVRSRNNEYLNPEWVDPHDWTKDKDPLQKLCPHSELCKPCENTVKSEYLRLVNSLFNPNEFRFDEATQFMYRNVHIHITKEQLEKLRRSSDPIYIDGLVSEVLAQTEFGTVQLVKEYTVDLATTVWDNIPKLPSFSSVPSISEINFNTLPRSRPILINFVIFVMSFFACRRFQIPYLYFILFAIVYCLYEYLDSECHRRIELNQAVDFIYGVEKNPCVSPQKMNLIDWFIGKDGRSKCRDFLEKQSTTKTQCGVIDLFHEFFANVLMKQLKIFFMTVADIVHSISATNGILITAVVVYFMKDILVTLIKSMFKYILNPTAWSRVVADVASSSSRDPVEPVQRIEVLPLSDIRDLNVSKALDLANNQMKIISEKMEMLNIQPSGGESSGAELLALKAKSSDTSSTDTAPSTSKERLNYDDDQQNESNSSSDKSFEEFGEEEIQHSFHLPENISIVTVNDTQLSVSTPFDYDGSTEDTSQNLTKSTDKSDILTISDSNKSNSSVEILSISSDAPL
ncbi:uncharacterized protein LOC116349398 [Contarinia nasturtii]|uniref:uncharacterized protein LOC116349398 n=1 Tax=Contarinia nasturtii TaxID=265458 RepID=UPI0012D448C6|nr:uncharacterized protein LOC116349398 [Contarinia nasturtii]